MQKGSISDDLAAFFKKCRQANLKITPQRTAVYRALIADPDHPSADAVYRKVKAELPNISMDTVNRTLITFAETGIIDIVEGHGDPRRFDPKIEAHHHLYCIGCGRIEDFCYEDFDRIVIPSEIEKRFAVTAKRVILKGYCSRCQKGVRH